MLNSGTSVGKNKATVHRYDAFYENGSVKPGDYTVTVYADGFAPLTTTVTVPTLSGKLDKDITAADTYVANKDNYTEASYAAFEEALTKAKEVAAKSNATDEEITMPLPLHRLWQQTEEHPMPRRWMQLQRSGMQWMLWLRLLSHPHRKILLKELRKHRLKRQPLQ